MISRWSYTQSIREVGCPKCNVLPSKDCRTPSGRKTETPHWQRGKLYHERIGEKEWNRRHTGFVGKIWDSDIE